MIDELAEAGAIESAETLWAQLDRLTALTCLSLQPELALKYRAHFPKPPPAGPADDDERDADAEDDARRAFHVLGLDVIIDRDGAPRLLEVNSSPSLAIDFESEDPALPGATVKETSPVDVFVKQRVLSDMLELVAHGADDARAPPPERLCAVVGAGAEPVPRELTLLSRATAAYDLAAPQRGRGAERGMGVSAFVRLARDAALLELTAISKADLEILFIRLCAKQRWSADQPAQKLMRASTFVRALRELADRAFPEEADTSTRFARLLEHIERNVASAAEDGAASDVASARGACASRL